LRARELGIRIGSLEPGPLDAITDVDGVRVGHTTLIEGDDVRTGVTVVMPPDEPVFAAPFRLNGNGEMTGLEWIREIGLLTTPIGLTNTHSLGVVRDALVRIAVRREPAPPWSLPVVAETWDGVLNDINGFHVRAEHVDAAVDAAADGPVAEGSVGGGTGMICHGFKGGIGTSSRVTPDGETVGVLVQANHGQRGRFTVAGVPVGEEVGADRVPLPGGRDGAGSIIVIVATDAPLLPHLCERLAKRASFGIARAGGLGEDSSGDLLLAFATGNRGLRFPEPDSVTTRWRMNDLFAAAVEATEEAILNALLAAETMTGYEGRTAHAFEAELLLAVLRRDAGARSQ
jgi:D-aminopeptidase